MERPELNPEAMSQTLTATLLSLEASVPLEVELHYDPRSPYAVTAWFFSDQEPVGWTFGRDLLRQGLVEPVGSGDVHVRPDLDEHGKAVVRLELHAPDGVAVVVAPALEVHRFVMGTVAAVRPGTESRLLDIDGAIDAVLVSAYGE
jgi:hypothetical protein